MGFRPRGYGRSPMSRRLGRMVRRSLTRKQLTPGTDDECHG
jgi:hypothetical protein